MLALRVIGCLIVTSLLLFPANTTLARTHFSFGLNLGVPLGPYQGYGYQYPYAYPYGPPYAAPYPPPG
jgi:hypothetical protein